MTHTDLLRARQRCWFALVVVAILATSACASSTIPEAPAPTAAAPMDPHPPVAAGEPGADAAPRRAAVGDTIMTFDGGEAFGGDRYVALLTRPEPGPAPAVAVVDAATGQPVSGPARRIALDSSCRLALVTPVAGPSLVLGMRRTTTPSRGVERGHAVQTLVAVDARTLDEVWTADIAVLPDDGFPASPNASCVGGAPDITTAFRATSDGRAALVDYADPPVVVDLGTGSSSPAPDAGGVLGPYLVMSRGGTAPFPAHAADLVDPLTRKRAGTTGDPELVAVLASRRHGAVDPHAAVSPDGSIVVVDLPSPTGRPSSEGGLTALSVPELTPLWRLDRAASRLVGVFVGADGTAVTFADTGGPPHPQGVRAVRAVDGTAVWSVENAALCAVSGGVITVNVNRQLAYLDAGTGEQIDFDAELGECPAQVGENLVIGPRGRYDGRLIRASRP